PEPVAAITWTSEPLAATPAPASLVAPPAAASAPLAAAPSAAASGGGVSMTFGVASDEAFDAVTRFLENPPPAEARRPSTPPPEEQHAQREVASPRETSEETRIDTRSPRELELSGLIERRVKALLPRLLAEGRVRTSAELQLLALRLGLDALETMFPED
ncbi:MAG: hypothetical protein KF901_13100, partial [Myxococcales bacterium]|nr:hypothetical protein [Myxococcales bacterium]